MSDNNFASFTWALNNFRYCWQKKGEAIVSPLFCIYMPQETKWRLYLFPRGTLDSKCIAFFLYRDKDCDGAENIKAEYSLDIQNSEDSCFNYIQRTRVFSKDMRKGFSRFIYRCRLFETDKNKYLEQGNLTIRCRMMRLNDKPVDMPQVFFRTIIGVEKRLFHWPLKNFSNLALDQKQSFLIKYEFGDLVLTTNLALIGGKEDTVCISIDSFDWSIKYCTVKIFVIDFQKQEVDSGEYEYWFNLGKGPMFPLKLTKEFLTKNKSLYMPNDVLTLGFELTISKGIASEGPYILYP